MKQIMTSILTPEELNELIQQAVQTALQGLLHRPAQPNIQTPFIKAKEVCKLYDISMSTLHRLVKKKIISPYYLEGSKYFNIDEINQAIEKRKQPPI